MRVLELQVPPARRRFRGLYSESATLGRGRRTHAFLSSVDRRSPQLSGDLDEPLHGVQGVLALWVHRSELPGARHRPLGSPRSRGIDAGRGVSVGRLRSLRRAARQGRNGESPTRASGALLAPVRPEAGAVGLGLARGVPSRIRSVHQHRERSELPPSDVQVHPGAQSETREKRPVSSWPWAREKRIDSARARLVIQISRCDWDSGCGEEPGVLEIDLDGGSLIGSKRQLGPHVLARIGISAGDPQDWFRLGDAVGRQLRAGPQSASTTVVFDFRREAELIPTGELRLGPTGQSG